MKWLFLLLLMFLAACSSPIAESGDTVSVWYTGKMANGSVFDTNVKEIGEANGMERPGYQVLTFELGAGQMIKGFDVGITGMKVGEKKTLEIPPALGYGEYDETKATTWSIDNFKKAFPQATRIEEGLRFMYQENSGQLRVVTMHDITNETLVLDNNHALAGKTLYFDVELVSVNKTQKE